MDEPEPEDKPEDGNQGGQPEPQPQSFNVVEFMKEKLPPYIVRCFLAAGFDTIEVIASMDVSENPENSISVIESFIEKYYSVRQQKGLVPLPEKPSLQILHINGNHWVVASTVDCPLEADILLYDSLYSTINNQTKLLLSELVHSTKPAFTVGLANVKKQSGSKDCGLFSISFVTDIHLKKS